MEFPQVCKIKGVCSCINNHAHGVQLRCFNETSGEKTQSQLSYVIREHNRNQKKTLCAGIELFLSICFEKKLEKQ